MYGIQQYTVTADIGIEASAGILRAGVHSEKLPFGSSIKGAT
jgi:hypothetical protein